MIQESRLSVGGEGASQKDIDQEALPGIERKLSVSLLASNRLNPEDASARLGLMSRHVNGGTAMSGCIVRRPFELPDLFFP